jgi:hypothetical protein
MGLTSTPDCSTALQIYFNDSTFKVCYLFSYMSGAGKGKIHLGKADVYLHLKGESGATVTHVDVELDDLNEIIKPKESSYVGGKSGGIFLGLKREMIDRAEKKFKK